MRMTVKIKSEGNQPVLELNILLVFFDKGSSYAQRLVKYEFILYEIPTFISFYFYCLLKTPSL